MNTKISTNWKLTTLTPLHIGDGEDLQLDLDYLQGNKTLDVIDQESLLQEVSKIPGAVDEMGHSQFDLQHFIKSYKLNKNIRYSLPIAAQKAPKSLRSFIKDGFGRPYVPATSLKGTLRTSLWVSTLNRDRLPNAHNFQDFRIKANKLGCPSPHQDFLRPLQVSDSVPVSAQNSLQAREIKFLNLTRSNHPSWIDFSSRRENKNEHQKTSGVWVETIKEGQEFFLSTNLDRFLVRADVQKAAKLAHSPGLKTQDDFCKAINRQALQIAQDEKQFFQNYAPKLGLVLEFYDTLIKQILETSNQENVIITRLAWGSGWKGMTGNWLNDEQLAIVRKKARLGRDGAEVFPKTRRLSLQGGEPCSPLGWVKLSLAEEQRLGHYFTPALEEYTAEADYSEPESIKPQEHQEQSVKSKEQIRQEDWELFKSFMQKVSNIGGQIDDIVNRVHNCTDQHLKKDMVDKVIKQAKSAKTFKKAKKDGKAWIQKLEDLANEVGSKM